MSAFLHGSPKYFLMILDGFSNCFSLWFLKDVFRGTFMIFFLSWFLTFKTAFDMMVLKGVSLVVLNNFPRSTA